MLINGNDNGNLHFTNNKSPKWISPSLMYPEFDEGDEIFGPFEFDKVEEPPPVHIIYPRPYNRAYLNFCTSRWLVVMIGTCHVILNARL